MYKFLQSKGLFVTHTINLNFFYYQITIIKDLKRRKIFHYFAWYLEWVAFAIFSSQDWGYRPTYIGTELELHKIYKKINLSRSVQQIALSLTMEGFFNRKTSKIWMYLKFDSTQGWLVEKGDLDQC